MNTEDTVEIWTDGACKGNPGPGGWGVLLKRGNVEKTLHGGEPLTTNNRMEMMAVIEALRALTRPCKVTLHIDSQYVMKGMTEWIHGWKQRGWRTADKKPVKNADLWLLLDGLVAQHDITWHWATPETRATSGPTCWPTVGLRMRDRGCEITRRSRYSCSIGSDCSNARKVPRFARRPFTVDLHFFIQRLPFIRSPFLGHPNYARDYSRY